MADKKSGGGSKLTRTQTVTVRFDPKLKYLADLAARKQRRTISSFIEWAVENALEDVILREENEGLSHSVADESNVLWDVDEPERFARLAVNYPELLTHDEQVLWKTISKSHLLKWGKKDLEEIGDWDPYHLEKYFYPSIRAYWKVLNEIASGEKDYNILPDWDELHSQSPSDSEDYQ